MNRWKLFCPRIKKKMESGDFFFELLPPDLAKREAVTLKVPLYSSWFISLQLAGDVFNEHSGLHLVLQVCRCPGKMLVITEKHICKRLKNKLQLTDCCRRWSESSWKKTEAGTFTSFLASCWREVKLARFNVFMILQKRTLLYVFVKADRCNNFTWLAADGGK